MDFFQNGVITTLQKLNDRPVTEIEAGLEKHSQRQRIALVLPALFSEFEGDAMPRIVEELAGARYLDRVIVSLDRADEQQFRHACGVMSVLPTEVSILWNDGPGLHGLLGDLRAANFDVAERGKGRGVWLAMGYALADKRVHTIALHDCDILGYRREMLARLVWPIVDPGTDFEFAKGYYARVDDRLYGRVTRLFYTPLVRTLRQLKADQSHASYRFFEFLDSFRYALSGEFAFIRSLAKGVRISPTWGLEVSILGEVFEKTTVERVCQVEIADTYKHKHQPLSKGDPERGLVRMARDIAGTLFRIMAQGGFVMSKPFFQTVVASYLRYTRTAIEQYSALAQINGLDYDRHAEIEAVEAFVEALRAAEAGFRADPIGAPLMSSWVRVRSALPDFSARLEATVEDDNRRVAETTRAAGVGESPALR